MFDRIPQELRTIPQWVCWRYVQMNGADKPTKVPYSARTGYEASVINAQHWSTYEEAVAASPNYSGIGFVLTVDDPYAFIDLDDTEGDTQLLERQKAIFEAFNSYAEYSPSGKGVHIIIKGHVQAGRKRHHVEVYSSLRYLTMTGNVLNDQPIQERQGFLEILWSEIGKDYQVYDNAGTEVAAETNETIFNRARGAANGEKFLALWNGDYRNYYPSQSEADFALIDILSFYSRNRHQIRTMFLASTLGARDKARRTDYIERMIGRSFDRQIPQLDFEGLKNNIQARMAEQAQIVEGEFQPIANRPLPYYYEDGPELPPGLVGELAKFIHAASPRPIKDIALMGALGLVAGIAGRAYNISGSGLNMYLLLIAKTGRGKEAMSLGIDKLMSSVKLSIPSIQSFIGPGDIQSGQALVKYMANVSPSFVSIIGEFDKLLRALSHEKANSAMIMLRKCILDLYNKSGFNATYRAMIYSDNKQTTPPIQSPAFSLLGECTPEKFYELLTESMISEGLLPRICVIEYLGERPALNHAHVAAMPSEELRRSLITLCNTAMTLMRGPDGSFRVQNIKQSPEATELFDQFDKFCDAEINRSNRDVVAQLWNRAHLKSLRLAGLISVGVNPYDPTITREVAAWAMRFIERDVRNLLSRFDAGEIGSDEGKQIIELRRLFSEYLHGSYDVVAKYGIPRNLHAAHIVPISYLSRRLTATAAFRNDRYGSNGALKRSLGILLDQAEIVEFNKEQLQKEFGTSARSFMVKEMLV